MQEDFGPLPIFDEVSPFTESLPVPDPSLQELTSDDVTTEELTTEEFVPREKMEYNYEYARPYKVSLFFSPFYNLISKFCL